MNKPNWVLDCEKEGWTEVKREAYPRGSWIGLPPGGNGGVTAYLYPPMHKDPVLVGPLAEKIVVAVLETGKYIGNARSLAEESVSLAQELLKRVYEDY